MAGGNKGLSLGVSMSEPDLDSVNIKGDANIGAASTDLIGFHGATAVDQAVYVADLSTSAGSTGAVGFTGTQAAAILAALNSILTCLREKGLMAAS